MQHSWHRLSHDTPRQTTRQAGRAGFTTVTGVWLQSGSFPSWGCLADNARTGLDKAGASGPTSISLWPGVDWVWSYKSLRLEEKKFCSDVLDYIATYVFCQLDRSNSMTLIEYWHSGSLLLSRKPLNTCREESLEWWIQNLSWNLEWGLPLTVEKNYNHWSF